jgi:rare lipoprotein A
LTAISIIKTSILFFIVLSVLNCAPSARFSSKNNINQNLKQDNYRAGSIIHGNASYYAEKFHGRKTANGEIFDMYKKSAAHKTLPFNTILNVTNLKNNKNVIVRINDRGPFVKGREIDLSYRAAQELGMIPEGVAWVRIKILELGK